MADAVRLDEYDVLGYRARAGGTPPRGYTAIRQVLRGLSAPTATPGDLPTYELVDVDGAWHVRLDGYPIHIDTIFDTCLSVLEVQLMKDALARRHEWFHMHAAALAAPSGEGALVMAGDSGNGKTTLTLALCARGLLPFADDVALVEPGSLAVHPLRRAFHVDDVNLRLVRHLPGADLSGADDMPAGYFMPARWAERPTAVRWVLFLERVPGASPTLTAMTHADAARSILTQALNLTESTRGALSASAAMAAQAQCVRLVNGDLMATVSAVERLVCGIGTGERT